MAAATRQSVMNFMCYSNFAFLIFFLERPREESKGLIA